MNRLPMLVTGLGIGASGLFLAAGIGLVVGASQQSAQRQASLEEQVALARAEGRAADEASRRQLDVQVARIRESMRVSERRDAASRRAALEQRANRELEEADRQMRAWDSENPATETASLAVDTPSETIADDLRPVREAVLTGDLEQIRTAVAKHNSHGGTPIVLNDEAELGRRGIALRARYNRYASEFSITLEASGGDATQPCTVLVAPGSIVKAGRSGDQDTAPIQARFLDVKPRGKVEAPATICCAGIHSNDPRSGNPRGIVRHADPRVARVAATAERMNAEWGPAQVAMWAVANDATADDVARAPGDYMTYLDPARDVLEAAGVDTNKIPLYAHASPRARRDGLGIDFGTRLGGG